MKQVKILIADDEQEVREVLKKLLLKKIHCTIELADDGAQVIERIKQAAFDLLLLDVKMPGLSGIDVIKEVRRVSPRTKIVVISGYDSKEVSDRALEEGAADYILKSYVSEEIESKIKKILAEGGAFPPKE